LYQVNFGGNEPTATITATNLDMLIKLLYIKSFMTR